MWPCGLLVAWLDGYVSMVTHDELIACGRRSMNSSPLKSNRNLLDKKTQVAISHDDRGWISMLRWNEICDRICL